VVLALDWKWLLLDCSEPEAAWLVFASACVLYVANRPVMAGLLGGLSREGGDVLDGVIEFVRKAGVDVASTVAISAFADKLLSLLNGSVSKETDRAAGAS
jgi:hypothetical protein